MRSRSLRLLTPAVLTLAALPAGALAASTQPESRASSGTVTVTTEAPTKISTSGSASHARFNGNIYLQNAGVDYFFRYAIDTGGTFSWTNQTFTQQASAPNTTKTVTATDSADDLRPGTSYLIRLVARLSDGSLKPGALVSFTTPRRSGSGSSGSGSSGSGSSGSGSGSSGSSGSGKTTAPAKTEPPASTEDTSAPTESAAPQAGQSVSVAPSKGTVLVRRPGTDQYDRLEAGQTVPMGSVVDTRAGKVALTSELPSGKKQTGQFNGGLFLVRQSRDGTVDLYLRGPVCSRAPRAKRGLMHAVFAAATKRRGKGGRRLFGRDKGGKFRTHGKHSQATVRGTRWLVEDRCNGTLTKVTEGAVAVRDFAKKRTTLVKAGGRYLARPRR